ncbi:glycosyltransferase [Ramlibacter sp. USB13]|uniref:Glycosyltransferase n=1 Tax=Ramlibacter cellulosilyticus TaxID=2764187 RepID=A0A923MW69_9BURK|nr:glycosyltransferase [Ramlibacter cellulosilyticus]MBC5784867.1 glycosyltransferase [Ramlibacter cellulosilyticus]
MGAKLSQDRPWIAYVGPFGFPNGGAAARRVLGNAQSLLKAGFRVVVASGQKTDSRERTEYLPGIEVVSLGERSAEHWPRPLRRFRYAAMGRATVAWLDSHGIPPVAVILYSGYTPYLLRLTPWSRRRGIPLIFDAVEWYQSSHPLLSLVSPYQWNIELAMRYLVKQVDGVIAISSYLARYYEKACCPVVMVPPTLDTDAVPEPPVETGGEPLQLCYTGTPGAKKDLVDVAIEAVLTADLEGRKVLMHIAGISESELLALPSLRRRNLSYIPPSIRSHGTLPQAQAMALVRECDFSVLIRPDNRVSRAGFSTKFVESFAVGTPVIANLSGDLGDYLRDGETGLICEGPTTRQFTMALQRALQLPPAQRRSMRSRCREVAATFFDYRTHADSLGMFIGSFQTSRRLIP